MLYTINELLVRVGGLRTLLGVIVMLPLAEPIALGRNAGAADTYARGQQPPMLISQRAAPRRPSATQMFRQGQELFEQEKYEAAIAVFDRLLRVYPAHTSAMVLYARSLYRLERITEAYYVFARIDPQILDPEASYEYAMSFYRHGHFEGALFAFRRIPSDHVLSDLANYYGALSALRLRRYHEAEQMLERAVVLPDKLARSRGMYLKHLEQLKLMQERQALAKQRQIEAELLRQERREAAAAARRSAPGTPAVTADQAPREYKHPGFREISRFVGTGYMIKHQRQDFHGFADKSAEVRHGFFEFLGGPLFYFDQRRTRRSVAGLQLRFKAIEEKVTGEERRNVVHDDAQDIVRIYSESSRNHTKYGEFFVSPWGEFTLINDFWLATGGELYFRYPDFERAGRTGNRSFFIELARRFGDHWARGHLSYFEVVNPKTKPIIDRMRYQLMAGYSGFEQLILEYGFVADQFNYTGTSVAGPDASYRGSGMVGYRMPLGTTLGARGVFENQVHNVRYNVGSFEAVAADGQLLTGEVFLGFRPLAWISGEVAQSFQSASWEVIAPKDAQEVYERNQPSLLSEFRASLSLNLLF